IQKFAIRTNQSQEIIRILVIEGVISGFLDSRGNWQINFEELEVFLNISEQERLLKINCLIGKEFGNLTITQVLGRKREGNNGALRLFVRTICKCGKLSDKPYYRLGRDAAFNNC